MPRIAIGFYFWHLAHEMYVEVADTKLYIWYVYFWYVQQNVVHGLNVFGVLLEKKKICFNIRLNGIKHLYFYTYTHPARWQCDLTYM